MAQECSNHKVAFVRAPAIMQSIPRFVQRDSEMSTVMEGYRLEVARLQGAFDSATAAYRSKATVLPPGSRQLEIDKLRQQSEQTQRGIAQARQHVIDERARLLGPIERGVQAIIDSVRGDRGCGAVFDVNATTGLSSVNRGLDLTQRVIDRIHTGGDTGVFGPVRPAGRGH